MRIFLKPDFWGIILLIPPPTVPIHIKWFLSSVITWISVWERKKGLLLSDEKYSAARVTGLILNKPFVLPAHIFRCESSITTSNRRDSFFNGAGKGIVDIVLLMGSNRIKPFRLVAIQ